MRKQMKWCPAKLLLMLSGAFFMVMTSPAWIPGFCAALAGTLLWCLMVWRLPADWKMLRDHLLCWETLGLALVICAGFGCNFYNTWRDSSYMLKLAILLGMEAKTFVTACMVVLVAAAVPAVGMVLSYFIRSAAEDYRNCTGRTTGKGISAQKALLILFVVYVVGISAILRTNMYYQDDAGRAVYGYKHWDYFGRYVSTALSTLVHMGDYLTDIAPLPQLLAMGMMACAGILILYIVYERTSFSAWELVSVLPVGLNPYFLECVSFRFDAPYMALSVLVSVLPLLYSKRNGIAYVFASLLSILTVCTSYQSATGVFPMLVILLAVRMWNQGKTLKDAFRFCLKSVLGYGAGLVYFKMVIMKPADAGYVSNALPGLRELLPNTMENLKQYYRLVLSDFKAYWLILAALIAAGAILKLIAASKQKKSLAAVMAVAGVGLMTLLCFGIYPVLADTLFAPRAMYGFGILLSLLAVTAAEGKEGIPVKMPAVVLGWAFFVFAFTYGNALNLQKEYTDFRLQMVIADMNDLEFFQSEEAVTVQISGSIGKSPILANMPQNYQMLNRLIPETFAGSGDLTQYEFFCFYDLPNVVKAETVDMTALDLPVLEDHLYHTIRAKDGFALIELK